MNEQRNKMLKYAVLKSRDNHAFVHIVILLLSFDIFFGYLFSGNLSYVILATSAISLFICVLISNEPISFNEIKISLLVISFILIGCLSLFNSKFLETSIKTTISRSIILLIGIPLLKRPDYSSKVIKYIFIFSSIHAFSTLFSYFLPDMFTNNVISNFPESVKVAFISFSARNVYSGITNQIGRNAYYIAVGFIIVFSYLVSGMKKRKYFAIAILLFLSASMLITSKRGVLFAIIVSCFLLVTLDAQLKRKSISQRMIKLAVAMFLLFMMMVLLMPETASPIVRFVAGAGGDITSGRAELYLKAFEMFSEKPLTGSGTAVFNAEYGTGVHSMYFQLLAENGIIGFTCFILIITMNIKFALTSARKAIDIYDFDLLKYLYFSLMFQIFFILYALTENAMNDGFVLLTYVVVATIPYSIYIPLKQNTNSQRIIIN
ncbi:MAG TPA: O-antigen ligase family protein [Thermoclostridium sp.]|nr:O-antigen ligase family protein [Thermoclostridium sp.]